MLKVLSSVFWGGTFCFAVRKIRIEAVLNAFLPLCFAVSHGKRAFFIFLREGKNEDFALYNKEAPMPQRLWRRYASLWRDSFKKTPWRRNQTRSTLSLTFGNIEIWWYHVICASGTCTNSPSAETVNFDSLDFNIWLFCNCASGTCTNGKSGYSPANWRIYCKLRLVFRG